MPKALIEIFKVVGRANKYIDETTPWILGKDESKKNRLGTVLYILCEAIRNCATALLPFLPKSAPQILDCFGIAASDIKDFSAMKFGGLKPGSSVKKSQPIFPRIDVKKQLDEISQMMMKRHEENKKAQQAQNKKVEEPKFEQITVDDFAKVELRVGKVLTCEKIEKSKKLLKLTVDLGYEKRTVVSGIAEFYSPEDMLGKKIVLVANLKPAKLCGVESQGMILCSDDGKNVIVVSPDENAQVGSRIR